MVLYRAEYMVGGTCWLPSKVIENQGASLGRLATKDGFQLWVESQKERLRFDPMPRVEVRSFCLTAEVAVIHGAQFHLLWVGNTGGGLVTFLHRFIQGDR